MKWSLLRSVADWNAYQQSFAAASDCAVVDWGAGPRVYPCLIVSYCLHAPLSRVISAYVYRDDALQLLDAAQVKQRIGESLPDPTRKEPNQHDFNRWLTAHVLTLVYFMRETGICRPEQYEERLAESLALVDEIRSGDRAAALAKIDPADRAVVDRLEPPS